MGRLVDPLLHRLHLLYRLRRLRDRFDTCWLCGAVRCTDEDCVAERMEIEAW